MVTGLERFAEHFAGFTKEYVLIGGTACFLLFEEAGLEFRVTKDLDIVLSLDVLDEEFINRFKEFIRLGGYRNGSRAGNNVFYRFDKPVDPFYPATLELFSGKPEGITLDEGQLAVPVKIIKEEINSLSALLLDENYQQLIAAGGTIISGIPVLKAEYLLLLKAKAWLDLSERKTQGAQIDSRDISKHQKDVYRLYRLLRPEQRVAIAEPIKADLRLFIAQISDHPPADLTPYEITSGFKAVIQNIRTIYEL